MDCEDIAKILCERLIGDFARTDAMAYLRVVEFKIKYDSINDNSLSYNLYLFYIVHLFYVIFQ